MCSFSGMHFHFTHFVVHTIFFKLKRVCPLSRHCHLCLIFKIYPRFLIFLLFSFYPFLVSILSNFYALHNVQCFFPYSIHKLFPTKVHQQLSCSRTYKFIFLPNITFHHKLCSHMFYLFLLPSNKSSKIFSNANFVSELASTIRCDNYVKLLHTDTAYVTILLEVIQYMNYSCWTLQSIRQCSRKLANSVIFKQCNIYHSSVERVCSSLSVSALLHVLARTLQGNKNYLQCNNSKGTGSRFERRMKPTCTPIFLGEN